MSKDKISGATLRSLRELNRVIEGYGEHWQEWCHSPHSSLSRKESDIIHSYQTNQTHHTYAKENGLEHRHVSIIYHKAVKKLKLAKTEIRFKKWLIYRELLAAGLVNEKFDIDSLIEPAAHVVIPLDLVLKLHASQDAANPQFDPRDLRQLTWLSKLSPLQAHELRRTSICIQLYLTHNELEHDHT